MTKDEGLFSRLRGLINSTVNEPEFSLKNFWKRGGRSRITGEVMVILIIVFFKILIYKKFIKSNLGIRAFSALSFFIGALHLFMIVFSVGSHIKRGQDGWRWIKWNSYTGEICFEKYYTPVVLMYFAKPPKNYPIRFLIPILSKKRARWERGLKWKIWYAFLNFLTHITRGMFILFV